MFCQPIPGPQSFSCYSIDKPSWILYIIPTMKLKFYAIYLCQNGDLDIVYLGETGTWCQAEDLDLAHETRNKRNKSIWIGTMVDLQTLKMKQFDKIVNTPSLCPECGGKGYYDTLDGEITCGTCRDRSRNMSS